MYGKVQSAAFLLLIGMAQIVCSGCDKSADPDPPEPSLVLDDYVSFCENTYRSMSKSSSHQNEAYHDGDCITGEPFTDVNGNGVYDEGIDVFVMSVDPTENMDLNDNGRYDGPGDPWQPGTPYDDLNGNGLFDEPDYEYEPGEPFMDINGNGSKDYRGGGAVVRWRRVETDGSAARWCFEYCDSAGLYVSDSGREYWFPENKDDSWWNYTSGRPIVDTTWVFEVSDSGLVLKSENLNTLLYVLPAGTVQTGSRRVTPPYSGFGDSVSYLKTVELNGSLDIEGDTIRDLLCVSFDDAWIDNDSNNVNTYDAWKLYFARNYGVVAVETPGQHEGTYFLNEFDSLPLSLTR